MKKLFVRLCSLTLLLGLFLPLAKVEAASFSTTGNLATARQYPTTTLLPNGKVLVVAGYGSSGVLNSAELHDPAAGTFTTTGSSLVTARYLHTATLLPNGKVLVAGGYNVKTSDGYLNSAELYDPATGTFTTTGTMIAERCLHTATLLPNGKVLIVGGNTSNPISAELYDPATGIFTATGNMNAVRQSHTATLLSNGKVLIVGGSGSNPISAELYDPATGTFSATGSLATKRSQHTATLLPNGKVLISGGYGNSSYLNSAELYDPATGTFILTSSMATGREYHTATLLPTGKVLIAGGSGSSGALNSTELFDPASSTFSTPGTLASARYTHAATLLPNGMVLIAGGWGTSSSLSSAELYNPSTGTFTATGSMTTARSGNTATLLPNGMVLIAGGFGPSSDLSSAELYNPSTGTFTATGSMTTARSGNTATLLPNGMVLIAGGQNTSGDLSTAELYNPLTGTFTATGSMTTAHKFHTATLLPNGMVLIAGGLGNSKYLSGAELYNPATGSFSATGSMTAARIYHTATLLSNGMVLMAGGFNGVYLSSAELYNPDTGTFTATGSMTTERYYHTATLIPNGLVLFAGGNNGSSDQSSSELFNPANGTFTTTGSMTTARRTQTATFLPNGMVLIAGGFNGSYQSSADLYNPATGTFTATGSMTAARSGNTATLLPNGTVLIAGGYVGSRLSSAELYDQGLGFSNSFRPVISNISFSGTKLSVTGSGFTSTSEASGGTTQSSATNYPLVQLQRIDNDQVNFLLSDPATNWSNISFTSLAQSGMPAGYYRATVFTNGIPSMEALISLNLITVTPSAGTNGSISPSTPQTVNSGATASFTITPNSGYQVVTPIGGTCPQGTLNGTSYTTGATTANCTVAPTFTAIQYTVTPSAGTNGSISPSTPQAVNSGATAAFTITPNSGYQVVTPIGGSCPQGTLNGTSYTTGTITANCTIAPTFTAIQYTVTPSAGANGSISPSTPQAVNSGATAAFTITPNSGYQVVTPIGGTCPQGTLNGTSYTTGAITANCTVNPTFAAVTGMTLAAALDTTGLTWTTGGNGNWYGQSITTHDGIDSAQSGAITDNQSSWLQTTVTGPTSLSFWWKVSSEANYDFLRFYLDGVEQSQAPGISGTVNWTNVIGINIPAGTHTLKWQYSKDGSVSVGSDTGWVDQVVLGTASYTVTPSAGANGSISPSTPQSINSGATATFTITPNSGFQIVTPIGGTCPQGTLNGASYTTGTITQACTVSATFESNSVRITNSLTGMNVVSVALSPRYDSDQTVYAALNNNVSSNGVFKSIDGGATWSSSNTGLTNLKANWMTMSPNFPTDQTVFVGTQGGVFISTNAGGNWNPVNTSIGEALCVSISPNFANDHTVFAGGLSSGVYKSTNGGATWTQFNTGLTSLYIMSIKFSPNYATDNTVYLSSQGQGVMKSSNGGTVWTTANSGMTTLDTRIVELSPNIVSDRTMFAGTYGGGIFKTIDGGASWIGVNNGLSNGDIHTIAVSPNYAADQTVLAGTWGSGVFITTDGGSTWSQYNSAMSTLRVLGLATSPRYAVDKTIYAGTDGNGIYKVISLVTVTPSAGANGSISPSTLQTVNSGSTATFNITPNSGYQVATPIGGTCPQGTLNGTSYTTGAITANCTVTPTFTLSPQTLTVSVTGTGTIHSSTTPATTDINCSGTCSQQYATGTVVTLTADSGTGYTFSGWAGEGCSGTGNCNVTMDRARNVSALFTLQTLTVSTTVVGGTGGTVSSTPSGPSIPYGTQVTFTITPDSGYTLNSLTDNGTTVSATPTGNGSYTYTIPSVTANHTLQATFSSIGGGAAPVPALGPWGILLAAAGIGAVLRRKKSN